MREPFLLGRKHALNFEARNVCGDRTGPPLQLSPGTSALLISPNSPGSANELSQQPAKAMATPACSVDSSWAGTHDGWRLRSGFTIPPRQELPRQTLHLTEHAQLFQWGLLTPDLSDLHHVYTSTAQREGIMGLVHQGTHDTWSQLLSGPPVHCREPLPSGCQYHCPRH